MKRISSFLLALFLVFGLAQPASASGGTLTIQGKSSFTCKPGIYTATDLFDDQFKKVMPGDKISEMITIKSGFSFKEDSLKVYLRALVHDGENLPVTGENYVSMNDFLSQLTLRVYNQSAKGAMVFEGRADELDGLKNNVYLGTFRKGGNIQLKAELDVPIELGNEYANRVGEVDWVFTVEAFDDPKYDNPKTGDSILVPASVMALSAMALPALILRNKRKKK